MENMNKVYDLLEKIYVELQDTKTELKSEIKKNRDSIDNIESEIKKSKNSIDNIESELKEFRAETNTRFDSLDDKLNNLEGTNASNHVATNTRLNKVSEDLDFLTHKEFQTEKEMFHIKQRLNKQKRNIK